MLIEREKGFKINSLCSSLYVLTLGHIHGVFKVEAKASEEICTVYRRLEGYD